MVPAELEDQVEEAVAVVVVEDAAAVSVEVTSRKTLDTEVTDAAGERVAVEEEEVVVGEAEVDEEEAGKVAAVEEDVAEITTTTTSSPLASGTTTTTTTRTSTRIATTGARRADNARTTTTTCTRSRTTRESGRLEVRDSEDGERRAGAHRAAGLEDDAEEEADKRS